MDSRTYELFEDNFDFRLIFPDTWMIGTKSAAQPMSCDCYLVIGRERAVLIDSGMSTLNIKDYIDELGLCDVPIAGVINTHSHFDHSGGNGFFGHAWMSEKAKKGATTPFGPADGYLLDYPIDFVKEGDVIDLGDRKLEIFEIGAHDPSSIAILDRSRRILFSGDELETGWINVGSMGKAKNPASTIEQHYYNMKKLESLLPYYDAICCGHHGSPIAKESIYHFLKCDEMILSGVPGDAYIPYKTAGGHPLGEAARVMRYKSAHICYSQEHIYITTKEDFKKKQK